MHQYKVIFDRSDIYPSHMPTSGENLVDRHEKLFNSMMEEGWELFQTVQVNDGRGHHFGNNFVFRKRV